MKAKLDDRIQTLVDLESEFGDRTIPAGSIGVVVECYTSPEEGYAVDVMMPNPMLVGSSDYESIILYPNQFQVITEKKAVLASEPMPKMR